MGEPDSSLNKNSFPVFFPTKMRNSRGKMLLYVCVLGVLCCVVFLLSSTHGNLKELEGINERCQQQRDSLSAQLQVVYEHKNRLEKSLQQEKSDHRRTKEANEKYAAELENKYQKEKEAKQKVDISLSQLKTRYSELEDDKTQAENGLKERIKSVETQKDAEIEKLHTQVTDLLSEKDKLETSNNGFIWKIEQHTSELNLCHLQTEQARKDLSWCHAQHDGKPSQETVAATQAHRNEDAQKHKMPEKMLKAHEVKPPEPGKPENKTFFPQLNDKPHILEKPIVMPLNNIGDGVLPKPMDAHAEDANRDIDAALEVVDNKKSEKLVDDPLLNQMNGRYEGKVEEDALKKPPYNPQAREAENLPQVAPPNIENVEERDDHGGERGEDGFQYANPDHKQQMENPVFPKPNDIPPPHNPIPPPQENDANMMMHDMMNKSPGEVNGNNHGNGNIVNGNDDGNNVVFPPASPQLGPIDNKIADLKNNPFLHRLAEGHAVMDDKNYEEADDDDRENDDEPANGVAPVMKGANNILQDNDFDDQVAANPEMDNGDNAKEVEGVVAAPK